MKNVIGYLLFSCLILASCTHDSLDIENTTALITNEDLIGDWNSANARVNGQPIEDFTGTPYIASNIMGFKEDQRYYFNYNSGTWKIEDNQIKLENERDLKVLSFEGDKMTLEAEIFAHQTYYQLMGIDKNEKVILVEDYYRRK